MALCSYIIPCECGISYIGKIGRLLVMQFHEHRHTQKEGLTEKSELAQHACKEYQSEGLDDTRILETESNSSCRKYKE
jgi:hypothetical protein